YSRSPRSSVRPWPFREEVGRRWWPPLTRSGGYRKNDGEDVVVDSGAQRLSTQTPAESPSSRCVEQERDLYRGLLELSTEERPEDFIERALYLVVQIVAAHKGYLELTDPNASEVNTSDSDES